jgi:hypothetical protein
VGSDDKITPLKWWQPTFWILKISQLYWVGYWYHNIDCKMSRLLQLYRRNRTFQNQTMWDCLFNVYFYFLSSIPMWWLCRLTRCEWCLYHLLWALRLCFVIDLWTLDSICNFFIKCNRNWACAVYIWRTVWWKWQLNNCDFSCGDIMNKPYFV